MENPRARLNLNDYVLSAIFEALDNISKRDLYLIMTVCARWKRISQPVLYRRITVDTDDTPWPIWIPRLVSCMKAAPDRPRITGAWMRSFGWTTASGALSLNDSQELRLVLNDVIYILLHASQLASLSLPLQSHPLMLSVPLRTTPTTLRSIRVSISIDNMFDAIELISQLQYLEHLSVTSHEIDWSTIPKGWTLPRLRTLYWSANQSPNTANQSHNNVSFLEKCSMPLLTTLTLGLRTLVDGAPSIVGYLKSLPSIRIFKTHGPSELFPQVIPFVTAPTLSIDSNGDTPPSVLAFLPPAVQTLIIHYTTGGTALWQLLDQITMQEGSGSLRRVQITFDWFWPLFHPDLDFSWLKMPDSYMPRSPLETRKLLYDSFVARLLSYSYLLGKRGIVILDAEGRTVSITHTNPTMDGIKSLGPPLRS